MNFRGLKSIIVFAVAAVFSLGLFGGVAAAAGPADAVKAFFAAAAKGDLKAYKELSTGRMLRKIPKPGSSGYKSMTVIGSSLKSVDNVQVKGDKAQAVAHLDVKKIEAAIMASAKEDLAKRVKDPKKQAEQLKKYEKMAATYAKRMSTVKVLLERKGGKWLVSRLKRIEPAKAETKPAK